MNKQGPSASATQATSMVGQSYSKQCMMRLVSSVDSARRMNMAYILRFLNSALCEMGESSLSTHMLVKIEKCGYVQFDQQQLIHGLAQSHSLLCTSDMGLSLRLHSPE